MSRILSILRLFALFCGFLGISLLLIGFINPLFPGSMAILSSLVAFTLGGFAIVVGQEWLKSPGAWICLLPLSIFTAFWMSATLPVQPLGWMDAQRDIRNGTYKVLVPYWNEEVVKMLKDQYQVTAERSGGCFQTAFERGYQEGYYSVVHDALQAKYGRNVVIECVDAVKKREK